MSEDCGCEWHSTIKSLAEKRLSLQSASPLKPKQSLQVAEEWLYFSMNTAETNKEEYEAYSELMQLCSMWAKRNRS